MSPAIREALIVGGGIAGPVAAMALQRAGIAATIHEARAAGDDEAGAFLVLAPNGVNALATLDLDAPVRAVGLPFNGITLSNAAGRPIGRQESADHAHRYGAPSLVLKRGALHRALRAEAIRRGIPITFGRRLRAIEHDPAGAVMARFADGSAASGDILIGCDGIHSRARRLILPDAPPPSYTGLIGCGGFTRCPGVAPTGGIMHMTFGARAFFGYYVAPTGEIFWFNNIPCPTEPARGDLATIPPAAWGHQVAALHADDPAPIPAIIRAAGGDLACWPIHDIPALPTWHAGRVVLAGDAAHATSPHAGQGASMAIEDALVLAMCLRDLPDPASAFAAYEHRRKARVERITRHARRAGSSKATTNPLALWLRDRLLPLFIRLGVRANEEIFAYRIDWAATVAPPPGGGRAPTPRPGAANPGAR